MATAPGPSDYDRATANLNAFGGALVQLINELLRDRGVHVHRVDFRVKERTSATRKIRDADDRYSGFDDLHDLLGVRLVTYFEDEVDVVADVLLPELAVDERLSVDKRASLDPDRFGYVSLHYVATLTDARARLGEYRRFAGRRFELQIRSILQHAWAEIEHDLGYKPAGAIPRDVRRRFSRLAGLLELADDEFARLRRELQNYEESVGRKLNVNPSALLVDQSTVEALVRSGGVRGLSEAVAEVFGAKIVGAGEGESAKYRQYISKRAQELVALGVTDVRTLQQLIDTWRSHVVLFAHHWLRVDGGHPDIQAFHPAIGLFYLTYCLAANSSEPSMRAFLAARSIGASDSLVRDIEWTWHRVVQRLGPPPHVEAPALD